MRARILLVAIVLVGCGNLNIKNGELRCSVPDQQCPDDYHCATDGACWKNGQDPDGSATCTFDHNKFDNCTFGP